MISTISGSGKVDYKITVYKVNNQNTRNYYSYYSLSYPEKALSEKRECNALVRFKVDDNCKCTDLVDAPERDKIAK